MLFQYFVFHVLSLTNLCFSVLVVSIFSISLMKDNKTIIVVKTINLIVFIFYFLQYQLIMTIMARDHNLLDRMPQVVLHIFII